MTAAFPAFIFAGIALAALPVVLHLLARRPPERAPLPTVRFLSPDARTLLRLQRRPTDRLLMTLRIGLALALGAAFASISWTGARTLDVHVVLLDAGADSLADWDAAKDEVRRLVAANPEDESTSEGIVLAYGLPAGARVVDISELDRLNRGQAPASAEDGLRALRATTGREPWREVSVSWVTRLSWQSWTRGIGLLRPALWPGRTTVVAVPEAGAAGAGTGGETPTIARRIPTTVAWVFEGAVESALPYALEALGVQVISGTGNAGTNPDWVFSEDPSEQALTALLDRAREGATVVLSGDLDAASTSGSGELIPWTTESALELPGASSASASSRRLVLGSGTRLDGPSSTLAGSPTTGSSVVAVYDDATPAAASLSLERGCVVYLASSVIDRGLTSDLNYPALVEALADGCIRTETGDGPLDAGGSQALARPDLPELVSAATVAESGFPLTPWLAGLALLLLVADIWVSRRVRA